MNTGPLSQAPWGKAWHWLRNGNVAVQALGPLCGFVTVLAIARWGGAAAQGEFAQTKAWIELLVVIGCFGFPQGAIYVVNRLGACARRLSWLSVGYSLAFIPLAVGITVLARGWGGAHVPPGAAALWLTAAAAGFYVLHGLWRGLYLTSGQEMGFALFSILPPVSLLICVAADMAGEGMGLGLLFWVSSLLSVLAAAGLMRPLLSLPRKPGAMPWRALVANGAHAFVQALLLVAQPLLMYALARGQGGGDREVGWLNTGVFLAQGLAVPVSMVSPLLFARWTASDDRGRIARLHAATGRWLAADVVLGLLAAAAVWLAVPSLFGAGHEAAAPLAAVMMLSLPLTCHVRLMAPALHAHDQPAVNTVAGLLRLGSLGLGGWALARLSVDPLLALAWAWTLAEAVASAWVLGVLGHFVREQQRDASASRRTLP